MKKKITWRSLVVLVMILPGVLKAEHISLNGEWELTFFPQPRQAVMGPDELAHVVSQRIPASVPGNVELDMLAAGLIADPMIGSNVYALRKYEGYQWSYSKKFSSPKINTNERVKLEFGGIDCLAEVWLNGEHLASVSNMFIEHHYDVTDRLNTQGENVLQVIIRSAVIEARSIH